MKKIRRANRGLLPQTESDQVQLVGRFALASGTKRKCVVIDGYVSVRPVAVLGLPSATPAEGVGTIPEQHVQVNIQVQRRAEALDQRDRPGSGGRLVHAARATTGAESAPLTAE